MIRLSVTASSSETVLGHSFQPKAKERKNRTSHLDRTAQLNNTFLCDDGGKQLWVQLIVARSSPNTVTGGRGGEATTHVSIFAVVNSCKMTIQLVAA